MRRFAFAPIAYSAVFLVSELSARSGRSVGFCVAQRVLDVPCPGCGVTRSISALAHGDLAAALAANIAGPVVALHFVVHLACFAVAAGRFAPDDVLLRSTLRSDRVLLVSLLVAWLWQFIR